MNPIDSLLCDLNSEQRTAVTFGDGPFLIVAGAGTGKTTVITQRIAWLIQTGRCKPDEILAVTFTDKAAGEMEERADRLLPYGYVNLWIMTFHAFCERVLQRHGLDIGIPNDFKLLDTTGAWMLVRQNLERFNLDYYRPLGNPAKFIHALLKHFSRAKDEDISPADYLSYAETIALDKDFDPCVIDEHSRIKEIADAYHVYERLLVENNVLDFGSLITYALKLFRTRPAVCARYREQFKYILVDEFQDTNFAQYELIKLLASPRYNLTIVSDDDQAIFRFRGASYQNIIQFKKDFPESAEISLIKNYRSRQNILDCAYQFIQHNNPNRLEWQLRSDNGGVFRSSAAWLSKKLLAQEESSGIISHTHCATHNDEVEFVIRQILQMQKSDSQANWSDFAILVRANTSAQAFISRMAELDIPYQFLSMRGLYIKPVIVDILSYCRLLDNYHDGPALYRVLSLPCFSVSQESIIELSHYAHKKGITLWDALARMQTISAISDTDLSICERIIGLISRHAPSAAQKRPHEVLLAILRDTGYLNQIKSADTFEKRSALSHLNQLYKKMHAFGVEYPHARLKDFLLLVSYEQEAGDEGRLSIDSDAGPDAVKILTVHAAKGLEFSYVFVVGMVDRRFPTTQRNDSIEIPENLLKETAPHGDVHLQEERRLFYVALTRAKKGIYLTSADDYGGSRNKKLSQFLFEIGICKKEIGAVKTECEAKLCQPSARNDKSEFLDSLTVSAVSVDHHGERSVKIPLPAAFSFTQLMAFRTCPLQYKFSFILRIPVFGKASFSFGKTMHLTLQKFFEQILEHGSYVQAGLFNNSKNVYNNKTPQLPSLQALFEIYDKSWNDDWYYSARQKEEYRTRGKEMLSRFYDELVKQGARPKAVERDFTMKFGAPPNIYSLKGRIDRVDNTADGRVSIVDYKTGTPKQENKLAAKDKEQLLLYQIASEEVFVEKPSELIYHYLENGNKISFIGTLQDKEALKKKVVDTINSIQQSDFAATPGWHCKSCDFKDICEFRQL